MKQHLSSLLLLALISFSAFSQQKNTKLDSRLIGIDTLLKRVLKDQHIAGFAVAVIEKNKIIYSEGFGYRDIENKKPVTPNTLFAIGSSSKAFTSGLLGLLQKEGKLSLDGKATSYLPQLRFFNDNMNNQITVRDMMCHRTGLSRYDFSWYIFNSSNRDSILQRVRYMEPNAGIREKWQYNNFMFLAQGMIAEKLTGKTWEQNIKEKFFDPLDMKRSNTSILALQRDEDASLPYTIEKDSIIQKMDYYNIDGMGPAGSINSSVNEMINWLQVWLSGGFYNNKEILPPSYIKEAASSQMVMNGSLPGEFDDIYLANYGLGWMISSYRGHYKVEHGGNIDGFSASVGFFPSDNLGIVVLTNQNASQVPGIVLNSIADRIFKLNTIDWNGIVRAKVNKAKKKEEGVKAQPDANRVLNTKPSHPLSAYVGGYSNPGYGEIKVSLKNDSLFARMGKKLLWLKHYHYDVFEPREVSKNGKIDSSGIGLRINFITGMDGKMESLNVPFDAGMKPTSFTYSPLVSALSMADFEKYIGEYDLAGTSVRAYVKDKILYIAVAGQPDYETVAIGNDTFKLKVLNGYSVKFEVTGSKAKSVSFIQPNGTFKAIRK